MSNKNDLTLLGESDLLSKYKEIGETGYFGELYNRYIPLVYGVCLKYLQNTDNARNAVMQLFDELLPQVTNHEIESFKPWLYKEVRNHCIRELHQENNEAGIASVIADVEPEEDILHLLYDEDTEKKDVLNDVRRCMDRLPDSQRICITHFFHKKMSYMDIVDKTGYALNTVKSNIENGKQNLKRCINRNTK